jgi:hypothetical protein
MSRAVRLRDDAMLARAASESGSLLAELVVATWILLVGVSVVAMTLLGPIRGMEQAALPSERFEGIDGAALEFVTAVRAARPSLTRAPVLTAEAHRVSLGLDHLVPDDRGSRTWSMELIGEHLVVHDPASEAGSDHRVLLRGVDPERSFLRYLDADRNELDAAELLGAVGRARVSAIELHLVVIDPLAGVPEVGAVHRAALRLVGPLA